MNVDKFYLEFQAFHNVLEWHLADQTAAEIFDPEEIAADLLMIVKTSADRGGEFGKLTASDAHLAILEEMYLPAAEKRALELLRSAVAAAKEKIRKAVESKAGAASPQPS